MNALRFVPWRSWRGLPPTAQRARRQRLKHHGTWLFRALLLGTVIGALTYLSPHQRPYRVPVLRVGTRATQTIKAPFLFYVFKSNEELAAERLKAAAAVPTILRMKPAVADSELALLDSVFDVMIPTLRLQVPDSLKWRRLRRQLPPLVGSLSPDALAQLTRVLGEASLPYTQDFRAVCSQILGDLYATGIVPSKGPIIHNLSSRVRLGTDPSASEMDVETLYGADELRQGQLLNLISRYRTITERGCAEAVHELLSLFIRPNLIPDFAATERLRDEARRSIAPIKRVLSPGESIIEKGATVTPEHLEILDAYADELAKQELTSPLRRVLVTVAAGIISAFLTLFLGYYLATREPEIFSRPTHLLLIGLVVVATAALAAYVRAIDASPYLTPTPLAAMLVTILFNPQIGLVLAFALALFVGSVFGDFYACLTCALTAAVAVYSVRHVRHRNQFYRAIFFLPLSYGALIAASDLVRFGPVGWDMAHHIFPALFTGIITPILTIGLLPIFESLFHITTDITLLELSDLNRPLLRELAIRAPGTYTHSLIMANLSESAAEAIGANPLLARVGCYYHDIGKMLKPEYFMENQGLRGGRNPHDHLTPSMSMLIIASHVKDGLALAEEHGLPQAIADLIPQHHGTTVIEYFYNRAVELGDQNARRDDFRYDGPRPQTKEAGILMLADSVESAARTLTERTPNRVRQLVRHIIQQKFTAGELDECALTLRDLHRIEDSFVPVLMGTLHDRIEYPWQRSEHTRSPLSPRNARKA